MNALQRVAHARGIALGDGCDCAYCGRSPFDHHSDLSAISAAVLSLRSYPRYASLCAGCRSILAGKPGSDPPPLRMCNLVADCDGIRYPKMSGLRELLVNPPVGEFVVSWATSRKKHHVLHAGISMATHQLWGSDGGTIRWLPRDMVLLDSVEYLLHRHSRKAILSADYRGAIIAKDPEGWRIAEEIVSEYRGRKILDFICTVAKKDKHLKPNVEENDMIDPIDDVASDLLAQIAAASGYRMHSGLEFWNTYFRGRIERHSHRQLAEFVSRLLDECECSMSAPGVAGAVDKLSTYSDAQCIEIEKAIRSRAALLVALAFTKTRRFKEDR